MNRTVATDAGFFHLSEAHDIVTSLADAVDTFLRQLELQPSAHDITAMTALILNQQWRLSAQSEMLDQQREAELRREHIDHGSL